MNELIIKAKSLTKTFSDEKFQVEVLRGVNLELNAGEMLAVVGPSGSGKSTLLHILGGLDDATSGIVEIDGVEGGWIYLVNDYSPNVGALVWSLNDGDEVKWQKR